MNPFRAQGDLRGAAQAPADAVVDAVREMVGQFADPFAFLRELTQNSLDAGASAVDVQLRYDPPDRGASGVLRVSVSDDGAGMTPDTITRCLLVLFRSSKEGDDTKIGRFGVGFFSVFAARPESVVVETGDGVGGWRLALRNDYTYELAAAPVRTGTTVSLRVPMGMEGAREFATRAERSLSRWCPHVRAALRFATVDVYGPGREVDRRIDTPFDLDAEVKVRHDDPRAKITLLVGLTSAPRVMFFNRGILLHESPDDAPPGTVVMIESPALHHTLSRDDIKRDEVWARAMELARRCAKKPLREALLTAFHDAVARGRAAAVASFARRMGESHWGFTADEVSLPLALPIDGATVARVGALRPRRGPRLYARGADGLVAALASQEIPVVDLSAAGDDPDALKDLYASLDARAEPAHARFLAPQARPIDALTDDERAMLDALAPLLGASVRFADPVGAFSGRLAFALDARAPEAVLDVRAREAFKLTPQRAVALSRAHPVVIGARRAMARDPLGAALILARSALMELDALDEDGDAALMRRAVTVAVT